MPLDDRNKLNRIEELKGRLFSKNYQTKIEHRDSFTHSKQSDVPDDWGGGAKAALSSEDFFMKTSVFKNFFLFSIAFFTLTLLYASYVFFAGGNTVSNDNIDISVLGNTFTAGGEELSLIIGITNKNSSALDLADLVVEYPKTGEANLSDQTERLRESLGTIPAGAVRNENLKLTLFGEQGNVRPIKISLEYRVEGSNAIFVKEKLYEVTINSTPINLSVDAPTTISPNQNITLNIKTTLNATKAIPKVLLKLDYPAGFQFVSAKPAPTLGNNVWSLGDLPPGAENNVSVSGRMIDVSDGEEKTFHIWSGSQSSKDKSMIDVIFNSMSHTVAIKKPFIEAQLSINGVYQREYATDTRTPIRGEIRWVNNLDTKINDLSITAKILGNAVNRKTINGERGFYDSLKDIIIWDKNSINDFREVSPGDSGSVSFSVSALSLFSSGGVLISEPSISIEVSVSGRQQLEGYAPADLNNFESSLVRIISDVGLNAKGLHYSGPFKNSGPIPPKVKQETTYSIHWSLSNTAKNISKAAVRAVLPRWMRFVGTTSPGSEDLNYNASTKEIIWNIGNIKRGTGITGPIKEVYFQVAFTPSLSQVGTIPVILNEAVLTGHDDFANVAGRVNKSPLRTGLDSDPGFPPDGGAVSE